MEELRWRVLPGQTENRGVGTATLAKLTTQAACPTAWKGRRGQQRPRGQRRCARAVVPVPGEGQAAHWCVLLVIGSYQRFSSLGGYALTVCFLTRTEVQQFTRALTLSHGTLPLLV